MANLVYGPIIDDAIERGQAARLRRLIARAKKIQRDQGDPSKAIRAGEAALKKLQQKSK